MIWRRKRIGVALGGGGARGLAHIGVLRAFEEESIPVDVIAGTSIGALVGGAFASGLSSVEMGELVDSFLESPTFQDSALKSIKEVQESRRLSLTQKIQAFFKNRIILAQAMFRPGILHAEDFQAMIDYFLPDIGIEELKIPFVAVATDLISGYPVAISHGSLRKAVMASCAVPGAVPPVEDNGKLLSDGGIVNLVPTSVVRQMGAEFVVGVTVGSEIETDDEMKTAMDVYVRATNIMGFHLEQGDLKEADAVIRPDVGNLHWTDFLLARDLIREGEKASRERMVDVKKALPFFKRWSSRFSGSRTDENLS
ncbi:MAG: patatin-like phospholipase family protein [Deltaproteobacteria bacterium]|nr:patatin-like phospholipase family protein [Deltaproteobacteria bacterium]